MNYSKNFILNFDYFFNRLKVLSCFLFFLADIQLVNNFPTFTLYKKPHQNEKLP